MTIFGEWLWAFEINAHNFDTVAQTQLVKFWIILIKTFRKIYILFGFAEVRISHCFSIVFANHIIMTSFIVKWFSNLHNLWNFE